MRAPDFLLPRTLEPCVTCRTPIAVGAWRCPYCGQLYPAPTMRKQQRYLVLGCLALVALPVLVFLLYAFTAY